MPFSLIHASQGNNVENFSIHQVTHIQAICNRDVIESLLSNLPSLFAENRSQTAAFGSAIKGGMLSMVSCKFNLTSTELKCLFVCL